MEILLRELCRLHTVALPPDLDALTQPLHLPAELLSLQQQQQNKIDDIESDTDEMEDAHMESEQEESEGDEDLPLEMEEGRNVNKVRCEISVCNWFCIN